MSRHPLHPAIVHFPIACWTLVVVADFASLRIGETAWQWSGGLLAVGCSTALLAMLAGLMELPRVPDGPALRDTYLHMGAMIVALMFFALRLLLRLDHLQPLAPDGLSLFLDAGGFLALVAGGWLGGRLVYGHGIGRGGVQTGPLHPRKGALRSDR
jgi:uncharacterized membrane protein